MNATRDRILDEATRQLLERGYDDFTVAAVRDALGLSSGSMFHAFPSKPALAAEVFVGGMRRYQEAAIDGILAGQGPAASVVAWIDAHLRWVATNRRLSRFLFATQPPALREAAADPLADANAEYYLRLERLRSDAAAVGLCRHLDVPVFHAIVMGSVQEYCRQWTRETVTAAPTDHTATFQRAAIEALRSTLPEE